MTEELRQRIPRPTDEDEHSNNGAAISGSGTKSSSSIPSVPLFRTAMIACLHVAAVVFLIYGFILRTRFHSGEECDMTYSMRRFVLLHNSTNHDVYSLYKFTDQRDVRQRHLYQSTENWCTPPLNTTTTIVLYVPGHWGSYSQARSLGAHGLQWTRQHQDRNQVRTQQLSMVSGDYNGKTNDITNFVYDVYAIDFAEQGGALHANLLYAQCDYVDSVIKTLVNTCHNPSILVVGHSVGGLVARAVPVLHPEVAPFISNLITLATPHAGLPFGFDDSIHLFYENVLQKTKSPMISISGGLRDELIPPKQCSHSLSVLASNVMHGQFGMDHRAIVWCHNLLATVRRVLFVMSSVEPDPVQRQANVETLLEVNTGDYEGSVARQRQAFRKHYGFFQSTAMESAMLYNAELLVALYAITGGIYCAYSHVSFAVVPLIVSAIGWWQSEMDNVSVVVTLALVANTIHWLVRSGLTLILARTNRNPPPPVGNHMKRFAVALFVVQLGVIMIGYRRRESFMIMSSLPAVFVATILYLPFVSISMLASEGDVLFLTLFLPLLPCLVAGKLYLIAWSLVGPFGSMSSLWRFLCQVALPVFLRIVLSRDIQLSMSQGMKQRLSACYVLAVVIYARRMLQVGSGYVAGHFVACLAWLDFLHFVVGIFATTR